MDTTWLDEFRREYGWKPEKKKTENTRTQEMFELRKRGWTLRAIGEQYGITRERVRQILGNTGWQAFSLVKQERERIVEQSKDLTTPELMEKLGISYSVKRDYHHPVAGENCCQRGNVAEVRAAEILKQHGFDAKLMPLHSGFDILVNGSIRIDVKSTYKPITSPSILKRNTSPVWKFQVRKNRRDKCDFYFCIITETEDVFIIPSKDVPANMQFVTFCYPTERPELAKWQNYHDAYDLLEAQP